MRPHRRHSLSIVPGSTAVALTGLGPPARMGRLALALAGVVLLAGSGPATVWGAGEWRLCSTPWTYEADADTALCGWAATTAGDVNGDGYSDVLVGSPNWDGPGGVLQGRVELFFGGPGGPGSSPDWTGTIDWPYTQMGYDVSPAGDVNGDGYDDILVGAGPSHQAFVWHGSPGGLAAVADWSYSQGSGFFGGHVSTAGDVNGDGFADVLIGETSYDNLRGRAHLFLGSASGLADTAAWTGEGERENSNFGFDLSTAFDLNADGYDDFVVSAPFWEPDSTTVSWGKVYVYHGGPAGPTLIHEKEGQADNERLGHAVAGIGAYHDDPYPEILVNIPGRFPPVYEFILGTAGGLMPGSARDGLVEALGAAGDVNGDGFADYIAGDREFISGPGRAELWSGKTLAGGTGSALHLTGTQEGAWFGFSVGTAGDVNGDGFSDVIVGEPHRSNGNAWEGRVYVYYGASWEPWTNQICRSGDAQTDAEVGSVVAGAGDVNGDGLSEYFVLAPLYDVSGNTDAGKVWLIYGGAALPDWTATGGTAFEYYGSSAAGAGDVNGDGYDDVIIGAQNYDGPSMNRGKVELYYGSATGLVGPVWTSTQNRTNAQDGSAVAPAGDVNNDGYADFLSGARNWSLPASSAGRATLYLGSSTVPSTTPAWAFNGETSSDFLGTAVTGTGDVNADGFDDILVTAPSYGSNTGRIYFFLGSASGPGATPQWTLTGPAGGTILGSSADEAGDVNGDGYADFIVGSPGYRNLAAAGANHGRAQLFLGNVSGTPTTSPWEYVGTTADTYVGRGVGGAGDVNSDGYSDLLVGSYLDETNADNAGAAFFFLGGPTLSTTPSWDYYGTETDELMGAWVAPAGDVDGDGFADFLVSRGRDTCGGVDDAGSYLLVTGNGASGGPQTRARMRAFDDSGPYTRLNSVPGGLRLVGSDAWMAIGRAHLRVEYQMAPMGTDLDAMPPATSPFWTLTDPPSGRASSADLDAAVGSLVEGTNYHYRMRYASRSPYFPHSPWFANRPSVPSLKQVRGGAAIADAPGPEPTVSPIALRATPNPFRGGTLVQFHQERDGAVTLEVFDVAGRRVAESPTVHVATGKASVGWDGRTQDGARAPEGVYFLRLRTPTGTQRTKVLKLP